MDLITYLKSLYANRTRAVPIRPTKLVSRDKTEVKTPKYKEQEEFKVDKKGLLNAFPKEMNWMNWEDKGFRNALLDAQIWTESRGNPDAVSTAGAVGLTQFIPMTWKEAKRKGWVSQDAKRTDPKASLKAQKELMFSLYNRPAMKSSATPEDRYAKTLAAYNAGYGGLSKAITKADINGGYWLDYMPNETRNYVPEIMNNTEEEYFKTKENYVSKYNRD